MFKQVSKQGTAAADSADLRDGKPSNEKSSVLAYQQTSEKRAAESENDQPKGSVGRAASAMTNENHPAAKKPNFLSKAKMWLKTTEPSANALNQYRATEFKRADVSGFEDPHLSRKMKVSTAKLPPAAILPSGKGPEPEAIQQKSSQDKRLNIGGTSDSHRASIVSSIKDRTGVSSLASSFKAKAASMTSNRPTTSDSAATNGTTGSKYSRFSASFVSELVTATTSLASLAPATFVVLSPPAKASVTPALPGSSSAAPPTTPAPPTPLVPMRQSSKRKTWAADNFFVGGNKDEPKGKWEVPEGW